MEDNIIELDGAKVASTEGDVETKPYTFRELNGTDVFLMLKIIGKVGVNEFTECFGKDSVKAMIQSVQDGNEVDMSSLVGISVVLEMANVICCNLPKCEKEIYQMLSNTSNLSVAEVKALDFVTFTSMVIDFVKKDEFKDFVSVASKLLK